MPTAAAVRARVTMLSVPASQVALAGSGYLVLVAAGRTLPAAAFAAISAFYMLLNTVARGLFMAAELELTRSVSAARTSGDPGRRATVVLLRRVLGLLATALVLLGATTPLLLDVLGHDSASVAMLFVATVTVGGSHVLRGPLAALGRYRAYSSTFAVDAACSVLGALVLFVAHEQRPAAWCAVFAVAPLVATLVVTLTMTGAPLRKRMLGEWRAPATAEPVAGSPNTGGLLWSVLVFLASQAVWNLAGVVVAARADLPEVAAGFAAISVLLRAPVLVFPAIHALLLPSITAEAARGSRGRLADGLRRRATPIAVLLAAWMVGAVLVVPPVTGLVFGLSILPGLGVVGALAASAVLGGAAALLQTQLVALGRQRTVALSWVAGLAVLLAVAVSPIGAVDVLGGAAQLGATVVVVTALGVALSRSRPGAGAATEVPTRPASRRSRHLAMSHVTPSSRSR